MNSVCRHIDCTSSQFRFTVTCSSYLTWGPKAKHSKILMGLSVRQRAEARRAAAAAAAAGGVACTPDVAQPASITSVHLEAPAQPASEIRKEPILSQVDASEFIDPLNPAFRGVAQVWAAAQEQAKVSQGAPPAEHQAKQQPAQPKQAKPCQQQELSPTAQVTVTANSLRSPSGSGKRKLPATPVRSLEEDPKAQEACFWRDMQATALPPASQAASQKSTCPAADAADNTGPAVRVSPAKRRKQAGTSSGSQGAVARRIATAGGAPAPDDADEAPPSVHPDLGDAPIQGPNEPLDSIYKLSDGSELELTVPACINKYLRQYQRGGVRFLMRQYANNLGGFLADDMGLGKTVQVISFLAALLGKTGTERDRLRPCERPDLRRCPILIVGPKIVKDNWRSELRTWGTFHVTEYHGNIKQTAMREIHEGRKEILITTYDTFMHDQEEFFEVPWHVVIFDEVHQIKNPLSKTYQACCKLKCKLRYGLSGTIMPNRFKELHSLFNVVIPVGLPDVLVDSKRFSREIATPLQYGQKKDALPFQLAKARAVQPQWQSMVEKYLKRRTKTLIANQLPRKIESVVFCPLSLAQLRAYRTLEAEEGGVIWPFLHQCDCGDQYDPYSNPKGCTCHKPEGCLREGREDPLCPVCIINPCLQILRKVANHLELLKANPVLDSARGSEQAKHQREVAVAELVLGDDLDILGGTAPIANFQQLASTDTCGKMAALQKLLALWHENGGNKVLIFSSSKRMLKIMEQMVLTSGYNYRTLDGDTNQAKRQAHIDEFNNSPSVFIFLITTGAGGVGINLTAANKVVIVDPSWSPAADMQAQDRAFRIGQRRDVHVFRLVAAGTIEEIVYQRQLYKQQQANVAVEGQDEFRFFEGVQGQSGVEGELWGMANLLKHNAASVAAMDMVASAAKAGTYEIREWDGAPATSSSPDDEPAAAAPIAAPDAGDDDVGLQQLLSNLDGAAQAEPAPQSAVPESISIEMEALQRVGVMGVQRHDALVGGASGAAAAATQPVKQLSAGALRTGTGGSSAAQPASAAEGLSSQGAGLSSAPQGGQQQAKPVATVKKEKHTGSGATCKIPGQRNVVDVLAEFLGIGALDMSFKLLAMTSDQQKSIVADCRQHLLALQTS